MYAESSDNYIILLLIFRVYYVSEWDVNYLCKLSGDTWLKWQVMQDIWYYTHFE